MVCTLNHHFWKDRFNFQGAVRVSDLAKNDDDLRAPYFFFPGPRISALYSREASLETARPVKKRQRRQNRVVSQLLRSYSGGGMSKVAPSVADRAVFLDKVPRKSGSAWKDLGPMSWHDVALAVQASSASYGTPKGPACESPEAGAWISAPPFPGTMRVWNMPIFGTR